MRAIDWAASPFDMFFVDRKVVKEKVEGNAIQNIKTISLLEEEPNYNLI